MLYDLGSGNDRERFSKAAESLLERRSRCELTERKPSRSMAQNRYLHVILAYFAAQTGYSLEEVKTLCFKRGVNAELFEVEREGWRGRKVKALRSVSALSTGELSVAIDRFRNWSAQSLGLYLPGPDDKAFLFYAEQEAERNKEFI